ncbi:MAG: c-type cytochrome [Methyloligellaceae bacterium]
MGKMIHAAIALLLAAGPVAAQAAEADLEKGEKVYKKCKICHEVDKEKNKVGPHLVGLFGRKAGSLESYKKYSAAMKAKGEEGLVWDAETLDAYLTKPKAFIPKGKMPFPGLKKEEDRVNVIGYLEKATKPAE